MRTNRLLIAAITVFAVAAGTSAQGQTLQVQLTEINPGLTLEGTLGGNVIRDYTAGVMQFTQPETGLKFGAFCVQPWESINFDEPLVYEIQNPTSLANSNIIARLIGAYLSSPATHQNAAAVQWAIWEVTSETSTRESLFKDSVRIIDSEGKSTATLANHYLANVMDYCPVPITYLTHPDRQDVVTWHVVPEPSSIGLAALSGLLLWRRRRN